MQFAIINQILKTVPAGRSARFSQESAPVQLPQEEKACISHVPHPARPVCLLYLPPPAGAARLTTKSGGVSTGALRSLNLGFNRGDTEENVRENYRRLADAVGVDEKTLHADPGRSINQGSRS